MSNRPSGILTPTDYEFLHNVPNYYEGDNARQSRYQRRQNIRRRIVTSLLDFQEIKNYLSDEQRRKIFADPGANGAADDHELWAGLESLLQWVYLGCREEGKSFDKLVTDAASTAEEEYHRIDGRLVSAEADFDVEVTENHGRVKSLSKALEEGDPLPARRIYKVPMGGNLSVDPEKVDIVRIRPEVSLRPEREAAIVDTILQEYLGIDAEIKVVGIISTDDFQDPEADKEEPTAAGDRDQH